MLHALLINYNRHAERRQGTFLSVNEAALRFKVAYFKQKNNRKVHIIANDTLLAKKSDDFNSGQKRVGK